MREQGGVCEESGSLSPGRVGCKGGEVVNQAGRGIGGFLIADDHLVLRFKNENDCALVRKGGFSLSPVRS